MKTFGKVLIGLGAFVAGTYAGAFISAYVAEKVMDSPLDESVLRKHARTNKSKLDYTVLYTPKSSDPNLQSDEDAAEDESDDEDEMVIANYKGSVKTFNDLPENAEIGDTYLVEDGDNGKGCIYFYSKRGYVIPDTTDGVSLNDLFRFNTDAPQDDTDTNTTNEDTDTIFADYKDPVKTSDDLPKDPEIGDKFWVEDAGIAKASPYFAWSRGIRSYHCNQSEFGVKTDVPQGDTDTANEDTEESNR